MTALGQEPLASKYMPNLVALVCYRVRVCNNLPNRVQLALPNLLFRSVGGSRETDFKGGAELPWSKYSTQGLVIVWTQNHIYSDGASRPSTDRQFMLLMIVEYPSKPSNYQD